MCDKSLEVLKIESLMLKKIRQLIVTNNEVVAIGKGGQWQISWPGMTNCLESNKTIYILFWP